MEKVIQAKHVLDEEILKVMRGRSRWSRSSSRWHFEEAIPDVPRKVLLAKLASMIRRGIIDGCTCGCRGDFQIKEAGGWR